MLPSSSPCLRRSVGLFLTGSIIGVLYQTRGHGEAANGLHEGLYWPVFANPVSFTVFFPCLFPFMTKFPTGKLVKGRNRLATMERILCTAGEVMARVGTKRADIEAMTQRGRNKIQVYPLFWELKRADRHSTRPTLDPLLTTLHRFRSCPPN